MNGAPTEIEEVGGDQGGAAETGQGDLDPLRPTPGKAGGQAGDAQKEQGPYAGMTPAARSPQGQGGHRGRRTEEKDVDPPGVGQCAKDGDDRRQERKRQAVRQAEARNSDGCGVRHTARRD